MKRSLITTVRVCPLGPHEHVTVWNRGGLAGELVCDAGDGHAVAKRLMPSPAVVHTVERDGDVWTEYRSEDA